MTIGSESDGERQPELLRLVAAALQDPDVTVRMRATESLKDVGEQPGIVAVFRKALADEHRSVRWEATLKLAVYGPALPELLPDLVEQRLGENPFREIGTALADL